MKSTANSLLWSVAAAAVVSLFNHSAHAQALVYDVKSSKSYSGYLYSEDNGNPKFGSYKSSYNSLFVMGPEEVMNVEGTDYGRHSYAEVSLYTWKSGRNTIKEYYVTEYPVIEGDQYSGANPTLCQMDAAKKNVMMVVNGYSFPETTGRATFAKPFKNAPAPVWYAATVTGKGSGVYTDDSSLLANEPYYGTSYSETISAKLNAKLTESVYNESYEDALATVIADLESKGFVEGVTSE
jgi:hypothetical protein